MKADSSVVENDRRLAAPAASCVPRAFSPEATAASIRRPKSMETVTAQPTDNYLEIVLKADVVTVGTAMRLIDAIAANLDRHPCQRTLVEVVAQDSNVSLTDSYVIWDYAREKSLCRTKLAYVVTGREVKPYPAFTEGCATKRGTPLRIFTNRKDAIDWLGPAAWTVAENSSSAATVTGRKQYSAAVESLVDCTGPAAHSETTTIELTLEHQT